MLHRWLNITIAGLDNEWNLAPNPFELCLKKSLKKKNKQKAIGVIVLNGQFGTPVVQVMA